MGITRLNATGSESLLREPRPEKGASQQFLQHERNVAIGIAWGTDRSVEFEARTAGTRDGLRGGADASGPVRRERFGRDRAGAGPSRRVAEDGISDMVPCSISMTVGAHAWRA